MIVYFDTETELIGAQYGLAPPLITCGMIVKSNVQSELVAFGKGLRQLFPNQDIFDKHKCSFFMDVKKGDKQNPIESIVLVFNREDTLKVFEYLLEQDHAHFVAHNTAFDIAVLSAAAGSLKFLHLLFKALDNGRIHCTYLRAMMETIANGGSLKRGFSLKDLVKRAFDIDMKKADVRLAK